MYIIHEKDFGLEIFSNIRDISTENYNKSS